MRNSAALTIRIPEGVAFRLDLAGPQARFAALAIDGAVVSALWMAIGIPMVFLQWVAVDWAGAAMTILYFVLSWGYGILLEWLWRGQTIGKRLLNLRVVDALGLKLTAGQIVVRNFLRVVDRLPLFYLLGGVVMFFSARSQRLGDLAANTVVVVERKERDVDWKQLQAGKYNSLRDHLRSNARLRAATSAAEADVALSALLRREGMDAAARVQLFEELAEHFLRKGEYPPETLEGLSGEQAVRNVVEILYRNPDAVAAEKKAGKA